MISNLPRTSTLISGVNPDIQYPRLYRVFAELWIYMGLAWLSLFFSWNVHMVVEAHKVLKKRRHRHRHFCDEEPVEDKKTDDVKPTVIDIFNFLSEKDDDYSTVIKEIGVTAKKQNNADNINRSKSCSDILATNIQKLDHSPRHRRMISVSEVFINATSEKSVQEEGLSEQENIKEPESTARMKTKDKGSRDDCSSDSENDGIHFTVRKKDATGKKNVQQPDRGETRFTISKVAEDDLSLCKDDKG